LKNKLVNVLFIGLRYYIEIIKTNINKQRDIVLTKNAQKMYIGNQKISVHSREVYYYSVILIKKKKKYRFYGIRIILFILIYYYS